MPETGAARAGENQPPASARQVTEARSDGHDRSDSHNGSDTLDRIALLERRVAALEEAQAEAPARARDSTGPDSQMFWALAGLRARVDDPGAVLLTGHVVLPDGRAAQWQEGGLTADLLTEDWSEHADVLGALGHPVRLRLLQRVLAGTGTVHELVSTEEVGTSGQVYHHLRQLVAAGWVRAGGGGRYEVPVARVVPLLVMMVGAHR